MANDYSIDIHNYITEQISVHERKVKEASSGSGHAQKRYSQGQLQELQWLRGYLAEHIDLKDFTYY